MTSTRHSPQSSVCGSYPQLCLFCPPFQLVFRAVIVYHVFCGFSASPVESKGWALMIALFRACCHSQSFCIPATFYQPPLVWSFGLVGGSPLVVPRLSSCRCPVAEGCEMIMSKGSLAFTPCTVLMGTGAFSTAIVRYCRYSMEIYC